LETNLHTYFAAHVIIIFSCYSLNIDLDLHFLTLYKHSTEYRIIQTVIIQKEVLMGVQLIPALYYTLRIKHNTNLNNK